MQTRHAHLLLALASIAFAASRARADAQADYDRNWLPREKRAVTPADRAKLAGELITAANRTLEKAGPAGKDIFTPADPKADLQALPAKSRQEVLLLCNRAYDIGSKQREGYAPAAKALGILQTLEPARRLECLQKLCKLYEDVYQLAPSKNLGISKGFAEVNLQLGQEQWFLLREKQARGKVPAGESSATIRAISTNYAKGLDIVRAAMSAIRPYAAGNKAYTGFLESAADVEKKLLESQRLLAGPLAQALQSEQNLKNLAIFQNRLKSNPADKLAADRVVRLYINELDDPAQVETVLKQASPEVQQVVSWLKEPVEALTPAQTLAVVLWCEKSNDNPASPNRGAMDVRLRVYGEAYETIAKTHDDDFQKVDAALKRATGDLAREHLDEDKVKSLAAAYVDALKAPPAVVAALPAESPRPAPAPPGNPLTDPDATAPENPVAPPASEPAPQRPLASVKVAAESEPAPERSNSNSSIFDFGE